MATHNISTMPEVSATVSSEGLGTSPDLRFSYLPDLGDGQTIQPDDIVVFDTHDRRLYKGVVKRLEYSLENEGVTVVCEGVDQFIDGRTWEAVNEFYNMVDPPCGDSLVGVTIQEFFDIEHVGDVAVWFNDIVVPASIQDELIPELATGRKGFLTAVQEIIKAFPYIQFVIEFDQGSDTLFPIGDLVLIDLRVGRDSHTIPVGGATGIVTGLTVAKSVEDTAQTCYIFARGKFTERYELAVPDWRPEEEELLEQGIYLDSPENEDDTIRLPEGHEFIRELQLFVEGAEYVPPPGVGIIGAQSYRLFPGADFTLNIETGEITLLKPEDGADWWWVNRETGAVAKRVSSSFLGNLAGTLWRRPVTYDNNHVKQGVLYYAAQYKHIGERPYRRYKVKHPIADFRIESIDEEEIDPETEQETGVILTRFKKMQDAVDVYIPRVANQRFLFENTEDKTVDAFGLFGNPVDTDKGYWEGRLKAANGALGSTAGEDLDDEPDQAIPLLKAHMLFPNLSDPPLADEVLKWFVRTDTGVTFEEGTRCLTLGRRQLVSVPPIYDEVWDKLNEANPDIYTDWATWAVLVRYTSWEEVVEVRNNTVGLGRQYRGVANSIFSYTRALRLVEDEPEVLFDNLDKLPQYATEVAEHFGQVSWEGSIAVTVPYNTGSELWEVPYKIGDTVSLSGELDPALLAFDGIINGIDYDQLERGQVTLNFGLKRRRKNPFAPRRPFPVDIEGDQLTGPNAAGLQDYGDR